MRAPLPIVAMLLALSGAAHGQSSSLAPSDEMQERFAKAYNAGDVDGMAAAFTKDAVRVTPSGIFQGRDAIRQGFQDALKLGLHDYSVRRISSRSEGRFIFNVGEWQAKIGGQPFRGYYTAILVQDGSQPKILEETVTFVAR